MKRITLIAAATAALFLSGNINAQNRVKDLEKHVYYFASDSLQGRKAGGAYSAKAAEYIRQEYENAGLKPYFDNKWEVPFSRNGYSEYDFFDIVGYFPGNDPVLKNEIVVLGAHFDHLGVRYDGQVFNGADDNASGSAALIEVAKELGKHRNELKRTVIIAGFDGEELGLFGSYALADRLKSQGKLSNVVLMASLDMVGWLNDGSLSLEGTGTIANSSKILGGLASKNSLKIKMKKFEDSIFTATDTQGFAEARIPTLAVTTGTDSPYHQPEDDAELIDYEGMDKICNFVSDLTLLAASDSNFKGSGKVAAKHRGGKILEIGPQVNAGSSYFQFANSSITTVPGFSYGAALTAKLNFGRIAVITSGIFSQDKAGFPAEGALYTEKGSYSQTAVTVPAYLALQNKDSVSRVFFGVGPFYRKTLKQGFSSNVNTALTPATEGWGYGVTFGTSVGPFGFSCDILQQNHLFKDIKSGYITTYASIRYLF